MRNKKCKLCKIEFLSENGAIYCGNGCRGLLKYIIFKEDGSWELTKKGKEKFANLEERIVV